MLNGLKYRLTISLFLNLKFGDNDGPNLCIVKKR